MAMSASTGARDAPVAHCRSDDLVQLHAKICVARLDVGEDEKVDAGIERSHHAILERVVIAHRSHLHVVADDHALVADIAVGPQRLDRIGRERGRQLLAVAEARVIEMPDHDHVEQPVTR